jgi:hypothetical protein
VVNGQPGGAGYKAQNNTQSVITDPDTIVRFQTELIAEHMAAKSKEQATGKTLQKPLAAKATPATQALLSAEGTALTNPTKVRATKSTATRKAATKKLPAKKGTSKSPPAKTAK